MRSKRIILLLNLVILLSLNGLSFLPDQYVSASSENNFTQINWIDMGAAAFYPASGGLSEGQSIVLNNKMYVFSGYIQPLTPTRDVYVFDPSQPQDPWTQLADIPAGVTHAGLATDGVDIYIAGGYVEIPGEMGRIMGYEKVWRYNVAANNYTALPNMPKRVSTGQMAYLYGKLHYIGGTTEDTGEFDLPDHFVLDLETFANDPVNTTWVDITATSGLPNPRQHSAMVVFENQIYYIAGEWGHNGALVPQNDLHRYDPLTDTWIQLADMPDAGRNHATHTTVVFGGRIIVMGGQRESGSSRDEVFAYNLVTNTWTELNSLPIMQQSSIGGEINGVFYFGTGVKNYTVEGRRRMWKGIPVVTEANTATPTYTPTSTPSNTPTEVPTETPTNTPTNTPTDIPTDTPTGTLTITPTNIWTNTPTTTLVSPTAPATNVSTDVPTATGTTTSAGTELLVNRGFEAVDVNNNADLTPWKLKNSVKDKIKCNTATKEIAHTGLCAFMFKGGVDESSKLFQQLDLTGLTFTATEKLNLSLFVNAKKATSTGKIKLVVKYSDGSEAGKLNLNLVTTVGYEVLADNYTLISGAISKIKLQVKHSSPDGKVYVDDVSLVQTAGAAALIPLP
ncbi:MAG: hypothetical protein H7X77_04775 [Anaerolineae bacterium]|nr:hypothetical protein [Anaerolineae bacterium]